MLTNINIIYNILYFILNKYYTYRYNIVIVYNFITIDSKFFKKNCCRNFREMGHNICMSFKTSWTSAQRPKVISWSKLVSYSSVTADRFRVVISSAEPAAAIHLIDSTVTTPPNDFNISSSIWPHRKSVVTSRRVVDGRAKFTCMTRYCGASKVHRSSAGIDDTRASLEDVTTLRNLLKSFVSDTSTCGSVTDFLRRNAFTPIIMLLRRRW